MTTDRTAAERQRLRDILLAQLPPELERKLLAISPARPR